MKRMGAVLELLSAVMQNTRFMDAYNKRIEEGRAVNMDAWIDEAENRGREEGRAEGRKDAMLQSVNKLMTKKGWSMDEALDVLDVPQKDRALIASQL